MVVGLKGVRGTFQGIVTLPWTIGGNQTDLPLVRNFIALHMPIAPLEVGSPYSGGAASVFDLVALSSTLYHHSVSILLDSCPVNDAQRKQCDQIQSQRYVSGSIDSTPAHRGCDQHNLPSTACPANRLRTCDI